MPKFWLYNSGTSVWQLHYAQILAMQFRHSVWQLHYAQIPGRYNYGQSYIATTQIPAAIIADGWGRWAGE